MNYLLEDKRSSLMSQGRRGEKEKGTGKSRYEMRVNSKVASTTREFNNLDMQSLFVHNILTINVPVVGETDTYLVRIKFGGFLDLLREQIERQNGVLDLRAITRALLDAFNREDVYISCSCADFRFRFSYWSTIKDINSGVPERRPAKITNPTNNKGPGCKHVMLVLSNNSWLVKVARVINNWIIYMSKNRQKQYADIVYPAIYGKAYEEPVQLDIDSEELGKNEILLDSMLFRLIQISENSKRLSDQFKNEYPQIPWMAVYGLRNRIVHDYGNVDLSIIYSTVKNDIPELYTLLNK